MRSAGARDDRIAGLLDPNGHPERPAIVAETATLSRGGLAAAAQRAAAGLARLGVGPGDRVALWLPNGVPWLVLYLACARLGAIAVAVNTRFRSAELSDILGRTGARVLAIQPGFRHINFAAILAAVDTPALARLDSVILCDESPTKTPAALPPGRAVIAFADLLTTTGAAPNGASADAGTIIFTTSGTTGRPKFVLHTQRSIARHAGDVTRGFGYERADTVLLQALPLCGVFGFSQAMAALTAGCPMVLMPAFDAAAAACLIARHRVTDFNATDDMILAILAASGGRGLDSLRRCGFAAFANAAAEDVVAAGDRHGVPLVGLYGMSEVQALFARQDSDAPAAERARAGGRITAPEGRVRVIDPDSGRAMPAGEAGELLLKGPSQFAEYFGDAGATAAAFTEDGYVRTGDLGYATGGTGFVFLARMGDSLRLGGFLVDPGEIDAHVARHPAVAACQTIGLPGPRGIRPVAFIVPTPGADVDETALRRHCEGALARFKVPERFLAIDRFPTTASANGEKIQRARLREMAAVRLG